MLTIFAKSDSQDKHFILEPLCSIFRITLLLYKDEGTKISVHENSLTFNNPGVFQGLFRNINGDKRDDLHNIKNPLLKAFEWYPVSNPINKYIYEQCIMGFKKLILCYPSESIICYTIQHFIDLLTNNIQQKKQRSDSKIIESPLLNGLRSIWTPEEIKLIYDTLKLLETLDDPETYISIINDIVSSKEIKVKEYIYKSSTTYHN